MKSWVFKMSLISWPSGSSNAKEIDDLKPLISSGQQTQRGAWVIFSLAMIGLVMRDASRSSSE
jgi:hypothetical protein